MPLIIAIDPGATGAIALMDTDCDNYEVVDMPIVIPPKRKGGKQPSPLVDGRRLAQMLHGMDPDDTTVVIEKVGAMPGQGVTSMFNFGNSAGCARGVVEALGYKIVFVTPQQWKKKHGLLGTEKDAARVLALKKFPELASLLKRKKDGGRADAMLIADWYASTTVH